MNQTSKNNPPPNNLFRHDVSSKNIDLPSSHFPDILRKKSKESKIDQEYLVNFGKESMDIPDAQNHKDLNLSQARGFRDKRNMIPLFIGGLSPQTSFSQLSALLTSIGPFRNLQIAYYTKTYKQKDYAFFYVESGRMANKFLNSEFTLNNKTIYCQLKTPKTQEEIQHAENHRVFIDGINNFISENDLFDQFDQFGDVKIAHIIKDNKTGKSKSFAFVEFYHKYSVQQAISKNYLKINGVTIRIRQHSGNKKFMRYPLKQSKKKKSSKLKNHKNGNGQHLKNVNQLYHAYFKFEKSLKSDLKGTNKTFRIINSDNKQIINNFHLEEWNKASISDISKNQRNQIRSQEQNQYIRGENQFQNREKRKKNQQNGNFSKSSAQKQGSQFIKKNKTSISNRGSNLSPEFRYQEAIDIRRQQMIRDIIIYFQNSDLYSIGKGNSVRKSLKRQILLDQDGGNYRFNCRVRDL